MEQLLDANTVATLLSVKPQTVYLWSRCGKLKPRRVGRLLRFVPSEIARLVDLPQTETPKAEGEVA